MSALALDAAACLLSGAAYGFAYRPGAWGLLAWASAAPLLWACERGAPGRAFLLGWLFGFVAWFAGMPWFAGTLSGFLLLPAWAAWIVFAAFCAAEGLQFALFAGCARWAAQGLSRRLGWGAPAALACAAAPVWVAVEWLFPEQFPKYSAFTQAFHLPMVQSAEWFGLAGICWLLIAVNAALYAALRTPKARRALAGALLLVAANEAFGLLRIRQIDAAVARRLRAGALSVGVAQGSEPTRRRPRQQRFESDLGLYSSLTEQALARGPLDLVVWPETTFEGLVRCAGGPEGLRDPALGGEPLPQALRRLLPYRSHMLLSALAQAASPRGVSTYNVSILSGPSGEFLGAALKRHLIPFGEYIPLGERLPWLYRRIPNAWALSAGRGPGVLRMSDGTRLGVLLCYEDLLPSYAREVSRAGAEVLVHQANDGWFGGRLPEMHLRLGAFRAIESRKFMIRAVQSGISAVIDPVGRVADSLPVDARGVLAAKVARMDEATPYVRSGDVLYWAGALLTLSLLCNALFGRRRGAAGARLDTASAPC